MSEYDPLTDGEPLSTDAYSDAGKSLDPPKTEEPEAYGSDRESMRELADQRSVEERPVVERSFLDGETGEPADTNRPVSAKFASEALTAKRDAEAQLEQAAYDKLLAGMVDEYQRGDAPQPQTPEFQQTQPQTPEVQPEYAPPAPSPELDQLLSALPPEGRAPFIDNYHALVQQASHRAATEYVQAVQQVQNTAQQYAQGVQQAGQAAIAGLLVSFPELQGLGGDPAQLSGAMQMLQRSNPERYQQLSNHVARVQQTVQVAQQQAVQQQQQHQARYQQQWRQYAEYHDAKVGDVPREVTDEIVRAASEHGVSKEQLLQIWGSSEVLRHSGFQQLLADGARYRIAQRNLAKAGTHPVAHVQRPGVSEPAADRSFYAELERQHRGQPLTPKQAAELVIAKRARR